MSSPPCHHKQDNGWIYGLQLFQIIHGKFCMQRSWKFRANGVSQNLRGHTVIIHTKWLDEIGFTNNSVKNWEWWIERKIPIPLTPSPTYDSPDVLFTWDYCQRVWKMQSIFLPYSLICQNCLSCLVLCSAAVSETLKVGQQLRLFIILIKIRCSLSSKCATSIAQ